MTAVGKLIGALMASVYAMFIVALPTPQKAPETVASTVYQPARTHTVAPAATNPPTPTSTTPLPSAGDCEAYVGIAYAVGWPVDALDTLKLAMRLESGCNPTAVGDRGDSIGLLQIHCPTWATPNRNWPIGWMQHYGWGNCNDLYDPIINLTVGLAIYEGWTGSTPGWHHWHALP
jgi:hypothetical protein